MGARKIKEGGEISEVYVGWTISLKRWGWEIDLSIGGKMQGQCALWTSLDIHQSHASIPTQHG